MALVATLAPAAADGYDPPTGGGGVSGSSLFVGILYPGQGGGSGFISADDPSGPRPYRYIWIPASTPTVGLEHLCPTGNPLNPFGWWYTLVVVDLSGATVSTEPRCVPLNPDGSLPPPPALPPVPTIGDIWNAALRNIPPPPLGVNPRPTGLTGLETWLWYDGPSALDVSASIGPWTVTGTARIDAITFDTGDGHSTTAGHGGSEAEPAARYTYETRGDYDITVTATWVADLVLSGPGLPARATPIGSAVLRSTNPYPVQEVRSVLVE